MFSSLIKFILSILILTLSFVTLFLFYFRIIILNESFYAYSLRKSGIYTNLTKVTKKAANQFLIGQITSSSDYNKLTVSERQEIEKQVESFTTFINEENLSIFTETNIKNILYYLNNKSEVLYLYLPINDWGLPEETLTQIPESLKSTDVNFTEILKLQNENTQENLIILEKLKQTSLYISVALLSGILLQVFFLFLYFIFGKKGSAYRSIGKLFSFMGIIILITSWIFLTSHNIFFQGLTYKSGWPEILAVTLIPIFIKPLIIISTTYGLMILFTGIVFYNKENKRQLVSKAKLE